MCTQQKQWKNKINTSVTCSEWKKKKHAQVPPVDEQNHQQLNSTPMLEQHTKWLNNRTAKWLNTSALTLLGLYNTTTKTPPPHTPTHPRRRPRDERQLRVRGEGESAIKTPPVLHNIEHLHHWRVLDDDDLLKVLHLPCYKLRLFLAFWGLLACQKRCHRGGGGVRRGQLRQ